MRHYRRIAVVLLAVALLAVASYGCAAGEQVFQVLRIEHLLDLNGVADVLVLDDDQDTTLSAPTDDQMDFEVGGADQVRLTDGVFAPATDDDVDLGSASAEFKDGYFDGTLNSDLLDVTGDITLENDETISNSTDGIVQVGGFLAFTEGAVIAVSAAGTITPTGSFQPITSTAAITNAVIADGSVAGQVVAISNENAGDDITILESGSNLAAGGDITLTGGAYDLVTLLWDGSRWIRLSFEDN